MLAVIRCRIFCLPVCYPKINIQIYRSKILPLVLYGCEIWSLTVKEERIVKVFENRVKVQRYLYRTRQALKAPGGSGPQISRQSSYESGKFVSPIHRSPLTSSPGNITGTHFCWWYNVAGRILSMKNPNNIIEN